MKNKRIILITLLCTSLYADPFTAAPGSKARGMAGAYTAISNTTEAGYYNAAGTASLKTDKDYKFVSLGYTQNALDASTYMSNNSYDNYRNTNDLYFDIGYVSNNWGISYVLYNMTLLTSDEKFINTSVGTLGVGFSPYEKVSFGLSLMMPSFISMVTSSGDDPAPDVPVYLNYMAFAASVKAKIFKNDQSSFDIGAVYRFGIEWENSVYATDILQERRINTGIPTKLSLGANYNVSIGSGALAISAEYDITYLSSVTNKIENDGIYKSRSDTIPNSSAFTESTTVGIGAEYAMSSVFVRAGYATTEIGRVDGNNWNQSIISAGLGVPFHGNIYEFSIENRTYDFKQPSDENSILFTLAGHFNF